VREDERAWLREGSGVVRLLDLLAGLSRLADLGFGLPAGEAVRSAALAGMLARSLDLGDDEARAGMYTALLVHLGCVGYAHETARFSGDELTWNAATEHANIADPKDVVATFLPMVLRGRPRREQGRLAVATLARGRRFGLAYSTAACEVGRDAARRLRLDEEVQRSIFHSHEFFNGKGAPAGLSGDAIPLGSRLSMITTTLSLLDATGGPDAAIGALRQRAGTLLDSALVDRAVVRAHDLLSELATVDPRAMLLDVEPQPVATVLDPGLVEVSRVFADLADLKSPHLHGHSAGVAVLARDAGERLGLGRRDLADLEVAGLLHDVGRVAISDTIWDKPGPLTTDEWEQVRLHAYHSERILAGSERLAPLTPLVGTHHERLDASGYHRGCAGGDLPLPARVVAAADAYQAMTHERPHRPALTAEQAEQVLLDDVRVGRLDTEAVGAVLAAAGHRPPLVRRQRPAGLTNREVEVLGLVAAGCSNRQIAERLVISRRTAEQHVQNVYRKIGVSSRAAAALFAMEHDLLTAQDR
jgi:HD-GYP domain-containing protein (c-di-GMP phosphodiesterase class II)